MTDKSQLQTALTFVLKTIKELESIIEQEKDIKTQADIEREMGIKEINKVLIPCHLLTDNELNVIEKAFYDAGYRKQGEVVSAVDLSKLWNSDVFTISDMSEWLDMHFNVTRKVK